MVNMGFDWRYISQPDVFLSLDTDQFHSGGHSLSVTFDGERIVDTGIDQFIPVSSNTHYNFTAYAMADDISAAQGPQFVISDADTMKPLLQTEEILGNSSWRQVAVLSPPVRKRTWCPSRSCGRLARPDHWQAADR